MHASRTASHGEPALTRTRRATAEPVRPGRPRSRAGLGRAAVRDDVLDGPAQQLQTGRVELVRPRADALRVGERARRGPRLGLARQQDQVRRAVDEGRAPRRSRSTPRRSRRRSCPTSASVSTMLSVPRSDAQTRPDPRAARQAGDLVDDLEVAGPTSIATTGTRPATSAWASSAWNVVVATRS